MIPSSCLDRSGSMASKLAMSVQLSLCIDSPFKVFEVRHRKSGLPTRTAAHTVGSA